MLFAILISFISLSVFRSGDCCHIPPSELISNGLISLVGCPQDTHTAYIGWLAGLAWLRPVLYVWTTRAVRNFDSLSLPFPLQRQSSGYGEPACGGEEEVKRFLG